MTHTWTNQVSSWRPYVLLDPNLRLYDNEFSSATVNWTKVFTSGGSPVVSVAGGAWSVDTTGTPSYHVYRADSGAPLAPWATVEAKVTAMPAVAVGCFAGVGLANSDGNFLGMYYNPVTGDLNIAQIVSGVLSNIHGATYSLTLPFTITFSFTGGYLIGHINDGTTNTLTLAYHNDTFDFSDPALLADFHPAWFVGTHPSSAGGVVSLDYIRSAYFGELSVREMYPVVKKADDGTNGAPVTDESGNILVCCTTQDVAFSTISGYCGWGTRWYDPVNRTLGDYLTRVFPKRAGKIKGDSDGQIVWDEGAGLWHIYQTKTADYPATAGFGITHKSTTTDLRNHQVLILDEPAAVTLPGLIIPERIYDPTVRYVPADADGKPWYMWFSLNTGSVYFPVFVKGTAPDDFSTLVAYHDDRPGEEGVKFGYLDGVLYMLVVKTDNTTQVYDLTGAHISEDFGIPALPANAVYHPHPSIVVHQYQVGGAWKRKYHRLTFTDGTTTADGVSWGSGWQFGSFYVDTSEELDGTDFTPPAVGDTTQAPGLFFALS